jgi:hypothetical protein
MKLTKEQQEVLRVIAYDLNCLSLKDLNGRDAKYFYNNAKGNINSLVKELGIKVIPEGD